MVTAAWPNTSKLSSYLSDCDDRQFTGRLQIWSGGHQEWHLLFCLGRILWAAGGLHPKRRWLRLMAQHCPQKKIQEQQLQSLDVKHYGDYQYLIDLVRQAEISGQQAAQVIRSNVSEVLFDILQQENFGPLSCKLSRHDTPDASLALLRADQILAQTYKEWLIWSGAGFAKLSPNLAPIIRDPRELLLQQLPTSTFQTFMKLVDGKHSLRDVAFSTQQDLTLVAKALRLYINRGLVQLVPISDFPSGPTFELDDWPEEKPTQQPEIMKVPVIAHVDDNPRETQLLRSILSGTRHRFVGINDSVLALPKLLNCKPDLIFLDLFMPVVNGFELCSQLRKTSLLKQTPVIILTSNEGFIDWARAKVVGSTAYLRKPIQPQQVEATVRQYLPQALSEEPILVD